MGWIRIISGPKALTPTSLTGDLYKKGRGKGKGQKEFIIGTTEKHVKEGF